MLPIKVPPLGESIVEATVSKWHKKEGDVVAAGDTIVELDTDKITVEVPALKPGVIAKRVKNEGDVVKVDEVLGELDEAAGGERDAGRGMRDAVGAATASRAEPAAAAAGSQAENVKSSPAARRIADERGIDIAAIAGTGRGGVVSKPDVLAAGVSASRAGASPSIAATPAAPNAQSTPSAPRPVAPISAPRGNGAAPGERETREKMTTRRKKIAENLLQSQKATAHLTTFNEVDMSGVTALREKY